jgi:exonuclease SbcC
VRILELSLRNYRQFEEVDLELPAQAIGIFGPNGSGKSTLMESIAVALYGVGAARTKKQEIRTHGLLTDCEIRLVFEHGGEQYEARRRLKGRGSTPEAELYGGGLLLASGVSEVDAEVQRLLHMDLGVFRASVYAEQKQLDAFSEVTAGKRKEMALRLLGIRPVDEARKTARGEARATKQSAEQLSGAVGDLTALEGELKEATDLVKEAAARAKAAAVELKAAVTGAKASRAAFEEADAVRQLVEKLTVGIAAATEERTRVESERHELAERLETMSSQLAVLPALEEEWASLEGADERLREATHLHELVTKIAAIRAELEALPAEATDEMLAEAGRAQTAEAAARETLALAGAERDRARTVLAEAQERVARASDADPDAPCPTCGQALGRGFATYLRHCKDEAAAAKAGIAAAEKVVRVAEKEQARLAKAAASALRTGEQMRVRAELRHRIEERLDGLDTEREVAAAPFDGELPDLDALTGAVTRARTLAGEVAELRADRKHLDSFTKQLDALAQRVSGMDGRLERLTTEADELEFDQTRHEELRAAAEEAGEALESARRYEREAADRFAEAKTRAGRIEGRFEEAKETERAVTELRSDGRYLDRTVMLLDGFRDHLVARVGPDLSREAEGLFRELTNHEYDDLKIDEETLAIHIADGDSYFPVERFSGSEADLANLALRVAISTHLSRVSGADLGILVLDEVLGSLDQERKDLMVRTMGRLSGRFHQLFVITHAESVKDQFPASIQVAKVARRRSTAVLA